MTLRITFLVCQRGFNFWSYLHDVIYEWSLTMQILDSIVAERSTFEKIVRPVLAYLKATPLSIKMGGVNFSTSGNRNVTSVSLSTGNNTGLEKGHDI